MQAPRFAETSEAPPRRDDETLGELTQALAQMERALDAMPDRLGFLAGLHPRPGVPLPPREPVAPRPVLTQAFRLDNVDELHVALKAALSIAICGLAYETLVWPGISACVFAILLLAQGNVGASLERAIVQICGVLLGAAWAFVVVVVAMPNMTSLASLLVMLFPLYLAVSWLAFGGGVTTAAALQMAMAAVLVILPGFGPTMDLLPARDRVVGILLGNVVFAAVNLSLWPVYAGSPARLVHIIRALAELEHLVSLGDHAGARRQAFAIHRSLAQALALQDQARFEPVSARVRSTQLHLTSCLQDVFQEALDVGRLQWTAGMQALPHSLRAPVDALAPAVYRRLQALAECFEKGELEPSESLDASWEAVHAAQAGHVDTGTADFSAFLILSRRLVTAVARLEDAVRSYAALLEKSGTASPRPLAPVG
jgi:uncharacterized membrane protein YccC